MRVFQMLMFLLLLAGFTSSSHAAPNANAGEVQMINADVGISNFDANFLQSTDQAAIIQAGYTSTFIATILADPAEFWQQTHIFSGATSSCMRSQQNDQNFSIVLSLLCGNTIKTVPQAILLNSFNSAIEKNAAAQKSPALQQVNFTAIAG